jgi:hypothetical protein
MYSNVPADRSTRAGINDEKQENDDSAEAPVEVIHGRVLGLKPQDAVVGADPACLSAIRSPTS